MMLDIFSSFDQSNKSFLLFTPPSVWLSALLASLLTLSIWASPPRMTLITLYALHFILKVTHHSTATHIKSSHALLAPLFMLLLTTNLTGLIPYTFSLSSHMLFSCSYALPIWLSGVLSSLSYNLMSFSASLLPSGAPGWLNPFLLIIELVSLLVRPLTLSFRLAANISTGHILLTLLGSFCAVTVLTMAPSPTVAIIFMKTTYTAFEVAIGAMQAYIFTLLPTLYLDDHPM